MAKKRSAGELSIDVTLGNAKLSNTIKVTKSQLKEFGTTIKDVGKEVAKFGSASALAFSASALKLNSIITSLAAQGEKVGSIEESFNKLGGSASEIEKARTATLGLLTSFELMEVANKGLLAGVQDFGGNLGNIGELSARVADTLGVDTKQAFEQVTESLITAKEKGLEYLGFNIDAKKAAEDFAKTNGLVAKNLDQTQIKMAIQAQALAQIEEVTKRLAPATDSVANAQEAFGKSLQEVKDKTGIALNESVELTKAWRDAGEALKGIDTQQLANNLAQLSTFFVDLAVRYIPKAIQMLDEFTLGMRSLPLFAKDNSAADVAGILKTEDEMSAQLEATKQFVNARDEFNKIFEKGLGKNDFIEFSRAKELVSQMGDSFKKGNVITKDAQQIYKEASAVIDIFGAKIGTTAPKLDRLNTSGGRATEEVSKLKKEVDKAVESFEKLNKELTSDSFEKGFEDAIKTSNNSKFDELSNQLRESIYKSTFEGLKAGVDAGKIPLADAQKLSTQVAEKEIDKQKAKLEEAHKQAYERSISFWTNTFENAITGTTFNLEDALKQVAVGFAAEMFAQLLPLGDLFKDITSPQGLGGSLAKQILGGGGGFSSAISGGIPGLQGGALLIGGEIAGGFTDTLFAAAPVVGAALGAAAVAKFGQSVFQNPKQGYTEYGRDSTLSLAGRGVAAAVTLGGSELALGVLSLGAETNKQTAALKALTGKLEEVIKANGGLTIFGQDGKAKSITDIKYGGASKVGDTAGALSKFGTEAAGVFSALGAGIKELEGVTEEVADKMALVLAETFEGSIDNARLGVLQLGYELEDFQKIFLAQAEKGQIRWAEYNAQIAAVGEAFKPGLVAAAATKQAYDNLVASGGRGIAAVKSIKDVAQEGLEAGLETIAQLGDRLTAEGANPEVVKALIDSAAERGVTKLKELSGAQNDVAGSIVGGMEALSKSLTQLWSEMEARIDSLNSKLESIPTEIATKFRIDAEIDPQILKLLEAGQLDIGAGSVQVTPNTGAVTKYAKGGIVSSPTFFDNKGSLSLAGESGLEGILPLTRINGKLGVSMSGSAGMGANQIIVNVDARGADAGVEQRVMGALEQAMPQIADYVFEVSMQKSRRSAW